MARRDNKKLLLYTLIVILIFGIFFFLPKLEILEQNKPNIFINDTVYSNLKEALPLRLTDEHRGIKRVKISLKKDVNETANVLMDQKFSNNKELVLQISLPKLAYKEKLNSYLMDIEVWDSSLWGWFSGNLSKKSIRVIIDDKKPMLNILANSYQIEQGGAASVVFEARDENLDEAYILTDKGKRFEVVPFIKENFYASLIAWDSKDKDFRAYVVLKDKAGNETKERIRYYFLNKKYRESNIALNDRFLDGKIEQLANQYAPEPDELDRLAKFKFVNETLRLGNEALIHKITSKIQEKELNENFKLKLFLPLKNAMKVADFADHRFYSYKDKFVSDSYHLGLDLASVAEAPIITNNDGEVVFAEENGIYGNNVVVYHGFGLYTLYGHCSSRRVSEGDKVYEGDVIANTGVSGLALGDHLHFGVLVQGVEVRPEQFQDPIWLKNNIHEVLENAKKIILRQRQ
ncbi:peptidase M23 [Campylobacter sp. MIT 99-7217]|uniref:M23 family metallopeptidase n=1 Tax=Campylobacter sp. MIT 99-7217 TaxID=535091 RepID=UPI0011596170|nr:M23 family metallopeptidase [Campylobacter sp. MIT 99-7217]TQR31283.1 peptidase M23 [Campylobacter sp. MIT 99-7217]